MGCPAKVYQDTPSSRERLGGNAHSRDFEGFRSTTGTLNQNTINRHAKSSAGTGDHVFDLAAPLVLASGTGDPRHGLEPALPIAAAQRSAPAKVKTPPGSAYQHFVKRAPGPSFVAAGFVCCGAGHFRIAGSFTDTQLHHPWPGDEIMLRPL
ncbi:uncharacterized protein EI97DRAFT_430921 [Westerdykella ornata]|uniref:Uncharacterized protein n=1 Tax=Westerdykella ornata TaxID=318751 RepID=A0A6A6JQ40_WESOR|nr:uncharacterized protein EI97DRAFT_430921 [Westerdykella ornata]KAF2278652.1 hypothetical protein EI97DRAFT_430921 [Westerdykella ornata]